MTPEIEALRKVYEEAQIRLIDIIANKKARGNVTKYREAILKDVNAELAKLDKYSAEWSKANITKAYTEQAEKVLLFLKNHDVPILVEGINTREVEILVQNATDRFATANAYVGRSIDDNIRKAGLEAVTQGAATGSTIKQTKENLINKLSEQGVMTIKDRAGRIIRLDSYAATVARSTTSEATNRATMRELQDLGEDLVKMSSHSTTCPICAPYEGRVYSISGNSNEYPPLETAFSGIYANIHPNCGHVLMPYIKKFDKDAEKTAKESNRPFDIDTRSKSQIDSYNRAQKKNALRNRDRKEWEEAKLLAPDQAPKTFSGYRKMRAAESERYQKLKASVKEAR